MQKDCSSILQCSAEKVLLFSKNGYSIKECKKCGHRFTQSQNVNNHLESVYSDSYFYEGKAGYPNYLNEKELLQKAGRKYATIISKYTEVGKVIDIGCAAGFILKGFEDKGWQCSGIEPNESMASYGRNQLKLNIITGGIESFQPIEKYDLVTLIEVIGAFYDLDKAMSNISKLLNQNGLVLVESMDMNSTVARIFGKSWHEYCPPSVLHWFSDKTLTQLFHYYGFELISKGYPVKRIKINHAISILEENLPNIFFIRWVLKKLSQFLGKLTILYPPFDMKWYIFKKV